MWVFVALLALPLIEIALLVEIGGALGLWPTLLWTVAGALLGVTVIREAGARTAAAVNAAMAELRDPARPAADGALRLLAGVLLILPGFFTDAMGLLLLVPPVRAILLRRIGRGRPVAARFDVIEGEYREISPREDRLR